jgi:hypothetical protein
MGQIGVKTNKQRRKNDGWQNCKYVIFYLGLEGPPISHGGISPGRSQMRWELDETAMDSYKQIYHGAENDESCLLVVVAGVGTRRFGRKSSSKSSSERKL